MPTETSSQELATPLIRIRHFPYLDLKTKRVKTMGINLSPQRRKIIKKETEQGPFFLKKKSCESVSGPKEGCSACGVPS